MKRLVFALRFVLDELLIIPVKFIGSLVMLDDSNTCRCRKFLILSVDMILDLFDILIPALLARALS